MTNYSESIHKATTNDDTFEVPLRQHISFGSVIIPTLNLNTKTSIGKLS